jgi:hypothetical protein
MDVTTIPISTAACTSPTGRCLRSSSSSRGFARSGCRRLRRRRLPLAVAALELDERAELVDLDEPAVLRRNRLRPSLVATCSRDVTQPQARTLHERHSGASGLRWWSRYESLWMNVTLFERAAPMLSVRSVQALGLEDPAVVGAAEFFGLRR